MEAIKILNNLNQWFKTNSNYTVVIAFLSIGYLAYMSLHSVSVRIHKTGWQNFPASMLDWLAIAGTLIVLPLITLGFSGIVKFFMTDNDDKVTS